MYMFMIKIKRNGVLNKVYNDRMIRNILLAFLIKGGSVVVGILTIPAYIDYFPNTTILGIWYTLLSLLTWISNFDFGIGNGMRNYLTKAIITKNYRSMQKTISSAYLIIGSISILFALVGFTLTYILDWNNILNVNDHIIQSKALRYTVQVTLFGVIGQFFFKLIASILNAMEKTALTSLLPLISNTLVLFFVSISTNLTEEQKIITLSWVYTLAMNIPYLVATIIVFAGPLRKAVPKIKRYDVTTAKRVLSLGGCFFSIQFALMIVTITNEILILKLYGADHVVSFQIYNKIFYTIVVFFSLITNPVWAAVTTASYEGKEQRIMKIYNMLLMLAGLATTTILVIAFAFQFIVNIWLKENTITIEVSTLISFVLYTIVLIFCYAESAIANGINKLNIQIYCYWIAAILKIPLCIMAAKIVGKWDTIILIDSLCLFPYIITQHIILRKEFNKIK